MPACRAQRHLSFLSPVCDLLSLGITIYTLRPLEPLRVFYSLGKGLVAGLKALDDELAHVLPNSFGDFTKASLLKSLHFKSHRDFHFEFVR